MDTFIGRKKELQKLTDLLKKKIASFVVIRGRRRIGKSRLAEEFSKSFKKAYFFEGLPPTQGVTAQTQREEFAKQMWQQKIPRVGGDDWSDFFWDLAQHAKKGKTLIVLDEISWMGHKDPAFLGKLKIAWDRHFKKNPQLVLVVSGSNSTWIEENIVSSTGFFGRISLQMHLKELPLEDCNAFWEKKKNLISTYEKLKILAITGGVPRYLEEIDIDSSAEENIQRLCFEQEGLLFNEFRKIFTSLFSHRSDRYRELAQLLVDGPAPLSKITKALKRSKGGDITDYLEDMEQSGYISRDYTWQLRNGKSSKLSQFRLSDNYLRFYLKYIEPNAARIAEGEFGELPSSWFSILGLQFENLVLNNRKHLYELIKIATQNIVNSGPYFQTKTAEQESCQIDLLIQTKFQNLYVCEVKFEKNEIGTSIIGEMQKKIERLKLPKGFSCRPVLIHVNGITDKLLEAGYFSHIIDFSDFLSDA